MTNKEIKIYYNMIQKYHTKYLKKKGIKLSKLKTKKGYTKNALTLVFLARNYPDTREVTKEELTKFIKSYYPNVNDVQQARHLGRQEGWHILSGRRGDISQQGISDASYQLISLETIYPGYINHRDGQLKVFDWEELKKKYEYRCASCGSPEGKPNYINKSVMTQLQKGHMNPQKSLSPENIIPQCQECNQGDRNRWIYDNRGRVVGLTDDALFDRIKKIPTKKIARIIYDYLNKKFNF